MQICYGILIGLILSTNVFATVVGINFDDFLGNQFELVYDDINDDEVLASHELVHVEFFTHLSNTTLLLSDVTFNNLIWQFAGDNIVSADGYIWAELDDPTQYLLIEYYAIDYLGVPGITTIVGWNSKLDPFENLHIDDSNAYSELTVTSNKVPTPPIILLILISIPFFIHVRLRDQLNPTLNSDNVVCGLS